MRVSEYFFYARLDSGDAVLAHGLRGAIDVVTARVLDWLLSARAQGKANGDGIEAELWQRLCERGYLVEDSFDERAIALRLGALVHRRNRRPSGFYLIPTYDCQLRCPYCCQRARWHLGHEAQAQVMDRSMVDAAFDAMRRIGDGRVRSLNLYGGEPLIQSNYQTVEYIVRRAQREGYNLAAVTNGVESEAFLDLMGPNGIRGVCVTIDGPPALHDRRRRRAGVFDGCVPGSEGTFDRVIRNIGLVLSTGACMAIRVNVDTKNLSQLDETFSYLRRQPWWGSAQVSGNIYPIYAPPEGGVWLDELELPVYFNTVGQLKAQGRLSPLVEYDLSVGRQVTALLDNKGFEPLHPRHPAYCGSKQGIFVFDPNGDVYTCVDAVYNPRHRVGRFYPTLTLDHAAVEQQARWTPLDGDNCLTCPYVLLCGGGCSHRWTLSDGHGSSLCHRVQATLREVLGSHAQGPQLLQSPNPHDGWL